MTLVKPYKTKFLLLSLKCIFNAPLKGFYDLEPMIHVACISVEYQTGAIADHYFEVIT